MRIHLLIFLITLFCSCSASNRNENTPAFPGADGCGKYTTGGRGGKVVFVTNLNDSGKGSLRHALKKENGRRTIIFTVSGTIYLSSKLEVEKGDFTLAGQTAPGDGICIAGYGIDIEADNIIIRYLRFRPGDINQVETDALTIKRSTNVIVDHCSMSWSTDETCSCYDNTNFTLQWCLISESLNNSAHHKGEHGYGGIWGGKKATFHHNLLAHHTSRNPRLHGSRYHKHPELEKTEVLNNVIYNWHMKCIYGGEEGEYSIEQNYFKPGPATSKKKSQLILEPYAPFSTYFFKSNYLEGNESLSDNNHAATKLDVEVPDNLWSESPFIISEYKVLDSHQAYKQIIAKVGASIVRDKVDQRIISEVQTNTFHFGENGIINSQNQVGAWPELKSIPSPTDSDKDGIPNNWEIKNHLNPNSIEDGNLYTIDNTFTNLEVYLNSLCN